MNLHLIAIHWNFQYAFQKGVDANEGGIGQKKNKSLIQIAEMVAKSKERTKSKLSKTKRPSRPLKTTKVDDHRILSLAKKNHFTTSSQVMKTLQEVGISLPKFTIKRLSHECKYRGFFKRCKPLLTLKNRLTRLVYAKKQSKSACTVLEQYSLDR